MPYRLAADIGGTFTDIVKVNDATGEYETTKVLTTPQFLTQGIMQGFDEITGGDYSQVTNIVHGTTAGLNAVIERRGARCALLTTEGFRDVLEIGRGNRPEIYNIRYRRPKPLIARKDIFEIKERLRADGSVKTALSISSLEEAAQRIRGRYEAVAVCFLNAYLNPCHEEQAAEWLRQALGDEVCIITSSDTAREWREYERTSTAVLNAYVSPITKKHLDSLRKELEKRRFTGNLYIMQSNGGVMKDEIAATRGVQILMSGPVGGVIGATVCGEANVIGVDMGGTSFDVSLIVDNQVETAAESNVEGFPALVPTVNVFSVGAGGGSLAWEEDGGMRVGPCSAGARPGPVCYGQGGTSPAITDANLVLGRLDPEHFLDGRMALDVEGCHRAMARYGAGFGLSATEAAEGICSIANNKMADAIREITVRRGIDPRDFTLLAFGGAGPMHAAFIAEELGIGKVMVPAHPGGFSAWGMLHADIRHDAVRTLMRPLAAVEPAVLDAVFADLRAELLHIFHREQIAPARIRFQHIIDVRYIGQEYSISLPIGDPGSFDRALVAEDFHLAHQRLYGHAMRQSAVEVVNARLVGISETNKAAVKPDPADKGAPTPLRSFPGVFHGREDTVRVYRREALSASHTVAGPAVIVELTATTVVPPGWSVTVGVHNSMVLTWEKNRREGAN